MAIHFSGILPARGGSRKNEHHIDFLFVLLLLFLFAASAFYLIMMGAGVYRSVVGAMDDHYDIRIGHSYLTEKIRQSDTANHFEISTFGDSDCIVLSEEIDGDTYYTLLYVYDGSFCELFCKANSQADSTVADGSIADGSIENRINLSPQAGQSMFACDGFHAEKINDTLYRMTLENGDLHLLPLYIHIGS